MSNEGRWRSRQAGAPRLPETRAKGSKTVTSRTRTKALRETERKRHSEALKALEQRRRRARIGAIAAAIVVLAAIGTGIGVVLSHNGTSPTTGGTPHLKLASLSSLGTLKPGGTAGPNGPEGVPIPNAPPLATTLSAVSGQSIDGIQCSSSEQTLFHIHAHLTIFVDGSPRQVPAGIGIPGAQEQNTPAGPFVDRGTCFYWLHTHAADGIIHIESPIQRTYTLGDFFDEWGQPLSPTALGPVKGRVVALYDGKRYVGNPRDIPLNAHAQIQLEVGQPLVALEKIRFPSGI